MAAPGHMEFTVAAAVAMPDPLAHCARARE